MHDTAFHIGTLAMNVYADLGSASILEVGSQSVNGSLRENALPTTRYVGIDIEEGDGVDMVVEPGKPWPLEDGAYDLILASSVFEHDPAFWVTFLEMCRKARQGGYIYINAPSNGAVHRYPQDNWRFYPDSGRALEQWARSQGENVTLVESFVGEQEGDRWNDFVAVFRKGRITKTLPKVFLYEQVPCSNVITWKSKTILNPRGESQDMLLLREANQRVQQAEESLAEINARRDSLAEKVAQLTACLAQAEEHRRQEQTEREALLERLAAEASEVRSTLNLRESELRQRQEEIEQTRNELNQATQRTSALNLQIDELKCQNDRLSHELADERSRINVAESSSAHWRESYEREVEPLRSQVRALNKRIADEIAAANAVHREAEAARQKLRQVQQRVDEAERANNALRENAEEASSGLRKNELELDAARRDLQERFHELATLGRALVDEEDRSHRREQQVNWLRDVNRVLIDSQKWWFAFMPRAWQQRRRSRRLADVGLFDAQAYLSKYPDVATSGQDPLHHYIVHGMDENRHI